MPEEIKESNEDAIYVEVKVWDCGSCKHCHAALRVSQTKEQPSNQIRKFADGLTEVIQKFFNDNGRQTVGITYDKPKKMVFETQDGFPIPDSLRPIKDEGHTEQE